MVTEPHTHKHTHTDRQDRLQYTAPQLASAQCNKVTTILQRMVFTIDRIHTRLSTHDNSLTEKCWPIASHQSCEAHAVQSLVQPHLPRPITSVSPHSALRVDSSSTRLQLLLAPAVADRVEPASCALRRQSTPYYTQGWLRLHRCNHNPTKTSIVQKSPSIL